MGLIFRKIPKFAWKINLWILWEKLFWRNEGRTLQIR